MLPLCWYAPDAIEVLNAAVLSYSPAIYWKKTEYLLERGLQVHAVVVFVDVADIQDEAAAYRIDPEGRVVGAPDPPFDLIYTWTRNSLTYRALTDASQWLWPHPPLGGCRIASPNYPCRVGWTLSRSAMDSYGRAGLERADTHMSRLAALLRRHGIPLTLAVYPWPQHLLWNDRPSLQVGHWQEWSTREGVRFVELFSAFFAEADAIGVRDTIARYFIPGDVHWSALGHRLVAERFARHFVPPVSR